MTTLITRGLRAVAILSIAFCTSFPAAAQVHLSDEATLADVFYLEDDSSENSEVEIVDQTQVSQQRIPQIDTSLVNTAFCPAGGCASGCGCPTTDCCGDCCESYSSECCDCSPCCSPCNSCCPAAKGYIFGQYLYLSPTGDDLAHAQQQDGTGGAGTTPAGIIDTLDYGYQSGYRVGAGCALDGCATIGVQYTNVNSTFDSSLDPPALGGGAGAIGSLVHHPQAVLTGSTGSVTSTAGVEYELGELVFHDILRSNCYGFIGYSLGGIYADIQQDFLQNGLFGTGFDISTTTDIAFQGGGLKAGIDGERRLGGCLSVYGKFNAAAVRGSFDATYNMQNDIGAVRLANAQWEEDRVIGIIEYELGLSACIGRGGCRVSAGYLVQHWTNMVSNSSFIDAVQADNYTDVSDTITFDGLTARVEGRF